MKFTDVRTLESFLKEYGMNSGASTYGSNQSSITAPATGSKSPSTAPSASPTTKKAATSPTTVGPAKKEVPQILAVRASDVPDDAVLKDIKNKPMGKVVSKVGDKPKADALVVDTGKSGKLQYQVLDKDQQVFIDNPEYKEESKATKLLSKLKIKNKKVRSIKTILRNGEDDEQNQTVNAGTGSMKESIFTQFDKLSLEEQLKILERVDANKLNEAWSKKQKRVIEKKKSLRNPKDNPCWDGYKPVGTKKKAGKTVPNCVPESVDEGAVPDTRKVTTLNRLLAKPLLANELDAHIDALSALPIPTMMNDFRKARVMGGDNTDLRPILRGYIRDSLHPDLLKQINLNEGVVTEAKGIMGRIAGDKFVKGEEQLEFQGVTVYPEESEQFESPEQRNAAVAEFEKQTGTKIEWTNTPNNGTLAFAVATLTDPLNNDAPTYWGRYFRAKMVDMMGSWGNAQVPAGWKLQKAGALKLDIGIDPQHLIKSENKHKSIDDVIATVAANSQGHQMQGELIGGLEQIKSGQNPVFENDIQHLPALRDYFGEIMGPCALMAGMVKGQAEDANQKLLQGAGWDKCQVFWPQSMNYALVDSIFIGPNGEEVGVSSKGGKGARASAKNIADAIKKADPKLVKKYEMTVAIIKIVDETPAIEAPFRIAELGKMLPAGLEKEIKSYIKSGKTDYVGLSNDAKELFNYGTPRKDVPGFNTGYALLALLAKKVAYEVNLAPAFSAGCLAFLNQSSIVQLYCKMGKQGNNARVTGWDAVYPPNFQGRVVLDGSKNYYSSRIGGKFAFGFV